MNRCPQFLLSAALLAAPPALLLLAPAPVAAQQMRQFPGDTERGTVTFLSTTQIDINGRAELMGPGVRIRNEQNMLLLSGDVLGQTRMANFRRDASGSVYEIWFVTPTEARYRPDGTPDTPTSNGGMVIEGGNQRRSIYIGG